MTDFSPIKDRIVSLDVLRGFALLGILLMNIQSFSMPSAAYLNPTAYGDLTGLNYQVWQFSHIFADQKFMSLFSMLFGVGVLVFAQRIEHKGGRASALHYRRTFWLLMFGLAHSYLFWYGDILFSYAMCGFVVYLMRNLSITKLLVLGLVSISISWLINLGTGAAIPHMPADALAGMMEAWKPDAAHMSKEIEAYTSGWGSGLAHRAPETFFMQTYVFLTTFFWRASGMMLLGMALYKSGFFKLTWPSKYYGLLAAAGLLISLALILTGLQKNLEAEFSVRYSMFTGSQYNYWGSVFMALCYASGVMLMVKHQWLGFVQRRLAAVGKMAFTNYILQTLICTGVFYSLGYLGDFSRVEQLLMVVIIWIVQLALSTWWLTRYKYGPLEWAWRSLTYWQRQPFVLQREQNKLASQTTG